MLYLSGCTIALHIGKLPGALPLLSREFGMTLTQTGTLVSFYALLIAFGGVLSGILVARVGYVRFAVVGIGLGMLGSFAGVGAVNVHWLMVTRAVEGLGWVIAVVAIPVLMSTLSSEKDRPVVMGLWGAFMATGSVTMLLLAPYLHDIGGWRLSWVFAGTLSGVGTVAALLVCYQQRVRLSELRTDYVGVNVRDLTQKSVIVLFFCFLFYSFQFVAITSFFPTLLVQDSGMPLTRATHWAALIFFPNAIGNVSAGWLINRGYKRSRILATASILLGVFACVSFSSVDASVRIIAAVLATGVGGVIPGVLFSSAGLLAKSASASGAIIGLMLMGAGLGQLLGPSVTARVVDWNGHWYAGGLVCMMAGLLGAIVTRWLSGLPATTK